MKKIIFISVFVMLVCAGKVSAQFGVNIGYALNSINYTNFGGKQNMNGFSAGLSYDLRIKDEWNIFTGLTYSQFGRKNTERYGLGVETDSYKHGFLDIPIHAAFVMEVLDDMNISVEAGPKLSYALFGTQTATLPNGSTKENIYDKKNNISPFNVLAGFGIGIQYNHLRFKMGYDFSLLNQYSGIGNARASHGGLSISLGYIFFRK
ncbi:MAG: PorT family protein [Paludibacter sp.]|nr:PorT family protein [Paludibacter sp.]